MISAFGVDHGELAKRDRSASGSAIAGAGAVSTGVGLVGGGIPGVRSNSETIAHMREGSWAQRTGAALSSGRGGIFGYRTDAHTKALRRFKAEEAKHAASVINSRDAFMRGRGSGKIEPEVQVIRHLKRGRLLSHGLLGAGVAGTAYGIHRAKTPVNKADDTAHRKYHGAMVGVGGAGAVGAGAAKLTLNDQAKRWKARENSALAQAERVVPGVKPGVSSDALYKEPAKTFGPWWKSKNPKNATRAAAEEAGRWRGQATQAHYFSGVYRKTGKVAGKLIAPSAAVAAIGAGGLALSRHQNKGK